MLKKTVKNDRIAAAQLKPTDLTADSAEARRLNPKDPLDRVALLGLAAQISESTIYCGNWKFQNALKHFPHEPMLRTVDRRFPYAKGGPLLVDQPNSDLEEAECVRKAKAIASEGLRYVYISKDMTLGDLDAQLKGTAVNGRLPKEKAAS